MEYTYAALLLHKVGKDITEDNLTKVIQATGATVDESKVKVLVESLKGVDIADKLANASLASAPAAAVAEAPKEEKKKEEPKADSAAGLASLFG